MSVWVIGGYTSAFPNTTSYFSDGYLSHAWDKYEQEKNYDAQKRRERYLRDRDAGKTGYKGTQQLPTSNPYGNYSSVYYNPVKAHEYYMKNRQLSSRVTASTSKSGRNSQNRSGIDPNQAAANKEAAKAAKAAARAAMNRDIAALQNEIDSLRKASKDRKDSLRADAKEKIKSLRDQLKAKVEEINKAKKAVQKQGQLEREQVRKSADRSIKIEKLTREKNTKRDVKAMDKKRRAATDPIKLKNASLRGRLESLGKSSDPRLKAQLKVQIAENNDKISAANASFTDEISNIKTRHTLIMRNNITSIRQELKSFIQTSSKNQKATSKALSEEVKKLRTSNQQEIKMIREKLKQDIATETESTKQAIASKQEAKKQRRAQG